jgi:hypothetical protein
VGDFWSNRQGSNRHNNYEFVNNKIVRWLGC